MSVKISCIKSAKFIPFCPEIQALVLSVGVVAAVHVADVAVCLFVCVCLCLW